MVLHSYVKLVPVKDDWDGLTMMEKRKKSKKPDRRSPNEIVEWLLSIDFSV